MSTTTPSLVQLPAALPNGATHVQITTQDGSVSSKPSGYVYRLVKVTPSQTVNGVTIPESQTNIGPESYLAATSPTADDIGGQIIYNHIVNPPPIIYPLNNFQSPVQNWLDFQAKTKGYNDIVSACSYKDDPNPIYSGDASYFINLRSNTWTNLFDTISTTGSLISPQDYIKTLKV